jgi:hypothetical protein
MSNGPLERITSNLYEDLGPVITPQPIPRVATAPTTRSSPTLKIKVKQSPVEKPISDATPRKAPSPPTPLMSFSLKSSSSIRTLQMKDEKEQMEKFQFVQSPIDSGSRKSTDSDEVMLLRKKVEILEMKLEELQLTVRV